MENVRPTLAAVVVTFNRMTQLKSTLTRLLNEQCDHIIVVDNGSRDGTREWLKSLNEPKLSLIFQIKNGGGAAGFEAGMRLAVSSFDPDWIVVMDDDARPNAGVLGNFLASDQTGWDAVSAAVYYPSGEICEMNRPSINPFWNLGAFVRTLLGGGRMGFHLSDDAYSGEPLELDVSSFVGLFVSRRAIQIAGYPDGKLFLYGDDVIYSLGLRRLGLKIRFDPRLKFEHDCSTYEGGAARRHNPIWKVYYNYRNGLKMYRLAAGVFFWLVVLVVVPKWTLNARNYGTDRNIYFHYLWRAIRDGLARKSVMPDHQEIVKGDF